MSKGLPFTVYGENLIILVQNINIMLLIWSYNKTIGLVEKLLVISFFGAYGYVLYSDKFMTGDLWQIVSSSSSAM